MGYSGEIHGRTSFQDPIVWTEAEFSRKEKKVSKKILGILISLSLIIFVTSFCFIGDGRTETLARERTDTEKKAQTISNTDQAPSPVIRLTGVSSKKVFPAPPCSVVDIKGLKVTLRDFYGKIETIEVEEVKNLQLGDKVIVKHGVMRVGISPR
jgi:hypothetical protein